ncbi:MAG: hypothetical protein ACQESR_05575 [Planctomycetota bacterium]
MERCPTQAALPLVGLAADKVIRDRYTSSRRGHFSSSAICRKKEASPFY